MMTEQSTELSFASARVVHVTMPPHEPGSYTSISDPFSIGVSFTAHSRAVVEDQLGRSLELSFPAGTCGITGFGRTTWLRVNEPSEAVEIYASPSTLASLASEIDVDWNKRPELLQPGQDPVIWGICACFRAAALGATTIDDLEAETLVNSLLLHVVVHHLNARPPRRVTGRLDQRRLSRVTEFIESSPKPPTLREMADVAAMSPFHFQRLFRATTGLSPHDYVMARRMERARRILGASGTTVASVAAQLGFADLAHFRRSFRRQFNVSPGALSKSTYFTAASAVTAMKLR